MTATATTRREYVKSGNVYFADNGARIASCCAGMSARMTGRDISGQPIEIATPEDAAYWLSEFGEPLTCECGKTKASTLHTL